MDPRGTAIAALVEERIRRDMNAGTIPYAEAAPMAQVESAKVRRGLHPLLLAGPPAAQGFDAWTTSRNLDLGATEMNPVMAPLAGNDAALYLTKLGLGGLTSLGAEALARRGHKTAGKLLAGLGTALPAAAGAVNLHRAASR